MQSDAPAGRAHLSRGVTRSAKIDECSTLWSTCEPKVKNVLRFGESHCKNAKKLGSVSVNSTQVARKTGKKTKCQKASPDARLDSTEAKKRPNNKRLHLAGYAFSKEN